MLKHLNICTLNENYISCNHLSSLKHLTHMSIESVERFINFRALKNIKKLTLIGPIYPLTYLQNKSVEHLYIQNCYTVYDHPYGLKNLKELVIENLYIHEKIKSSDSMVMVRWWIKFFQLSDSRIEKVVLKGIVITRNNYMGEEVRNYFDKNNPSSNIRFINDEECNSHGLLIRSLNRFM